MAETAPETAGQSMFRAEYEQELETWLRHRFRNLCITYIILGALEMLLWSLFAVGDEEARAMLIGLTGRIARLAVVVYYLAGRNWRTASREQILGAATWMILILGSVSLLALLGFRALGQPEPVPMILPLFFWHFSACLFLPWRPRESLRPFIPLLVVWAAIQLLLIGDADVVSRVLTVVFGPGVLLPGLGIASWRMSRHSQSFRTRMVGKQFVTMRREFSQARQIHESLFPQRYDDGYVSFDYTYTPMRELGGDFVHLYVSPEGVIHLTLLDVTGHGLAAALTVNRLYGELERIRAENPRAEPEEIITLLNRYIHLTMARHNIYATGVSVMLDPYVGEVCWVSAGHPPLLRRGANGSVTALEATTVVLGAFGDEEFIADPQRIELSPGDVVVVYTDGAFEARNRLGRQLGLNTLHDLLRKQPAPGNWPQFIVSAVEKHNAGSTEDDVLVASLTFTQTRTQPAHLEETIAAS
ncbi:MAG: serine/threonine-protein phosphatase [Phycisphaerales bacterium]|nr:MAG: serine/threonine-protein phosphatase [Phycisphaerales bacterium]